MEHILEDSGSRRDFVTGAVRDIVTGKGRFDLISPIALLRLAQHYENGALKYSARNWEKGIPLSVYLDSAERHINRFKEGSRTEDHMAAVMWNAAGEMHTEEMVKRGILPKELNDLQNYLSTDDRIKEKSS